MAEIVASECRMTGIINVNAGFQPANSTDRQTNLESMLHLSIAFDAPCSRRSTASNTLRTTASAQLKSEPAVRRRVSKRIRNIGDANLKPIVNLD